MRRGLVVLLALFLVNLPFAHETLTDLRVERSGREVEATVLETQQVNGRNFVDYRLPRSVDPERTRFSARVDDATYAEAKATEVLAVRVVPGQPTANRPDGEVGNRLFAVVAIAADLVLLLVGLAWWRRRRGSRLEVVGVSGDEVTLRSESRTLTACGPPSWVAGLHPGARVSGSFHLAANGDVLPGPAHAGFEQVHGSSYAVGGRVVDARMGRMVLDLGEGPVLVVETGEHRIRADIRDTTEVHGTLCFTPGRGA